MLFLNSCGNDDSQFSEAQGKRASQPMLNADSVKVDKSEAFHTVGGRTVYGGGGIIPDIFV
ncbi:MAG: S41 family peptidase, partial [Paludibacteraceae bacterium]|nr:S41 family peptidase [Paludibacteraceae bacterium]